MSTSNPNVAGQMYVQPDYTSSEYNLNSSMMASILALQQMPLWQRRDVFRAWDAKTSPLTYKYMDFKPSVALSIKKVRDLLVESKLYLSAPSDFNDPYDFQAHLTLDSNAATRRRNFERSAKNIVKKNPHILPTIHSRSKKVAELVRRVVATSNQNPEWLNDVFNKARDSIGVFCFAEDARNLLMWSHYAGGHTGICLQFNVVRDPGVLMLAHKVSYQELLPRLKWPRDRLKIVDGVLLRKGKIWELEREVRYVSQTTVRDSIAFNGQAVSGLILGSRFPAAEQPVLRELLDERASRGLAPPKLYRAERRNDSYGVYLRGVALADL